MNNSIIPVTPGLMALLNASQNGVSPFRNEIFLLEVVVAGTSFCHDIKSVEEQIAPQKVLTLKREPSNEHDEQAIAIYCENVKTGYVPAEMNLVCARLMDAGKMFFCRVVSKEWRKDWLKIKVNIYMLD